MPRSVIYSALAVPISVAGTEPFPKAFPIIVAKGKSAIPSVCPPTLTIVKPIIALIADGRSWLHCLFIAIIPITTTNPMINTDWLR